MYCTHWREIVCVCMFYARSTSGLACLSCSACLRRASRSGVAAADVEGVVPEDDDEEEVALEVLDLVSKGFFLAGAASRSVCNSLKEPIFSFTRLRICCFSTTDE